jgi:DNA-binding CsgD family transcriptional regulator
VEAAKVGEFLDGLRRGSGSLLLEGELGIGKTTVLEWGRRVASERGLTVLSGYPIEAEFPLEFAGMADLLDEVPLALLDGLPAPQRDALRVAVLRAELPEAPLDARTIATAVLNVLRALATSEPVLLVVDDLPWLDLPSARVLSFVLRRARDSPIGLLAAARTDLSGERAAIPALDGIDGERLERLELGPLSDDALRSILAGLGVDRVGMGRFVKACSGNPLFALELASRAEPSSEDDQHGAAVPPSLRRLLIDRIAATSASQRQLLLAVALAEEPAVEVLQAVIGDDAGMEVDLDALVRSGLLVGDAHHVGFAHPLMRSVVGAEASLEQRRTCHLGLAAVVGSRESAARHLGMGTPGPDENVANELEHSARVAAGRGACDTAAQLADLAVARTPSSLIEDRHRRVALTAEYAFDASEPARASALIDSIIEGMEPGPSRAELLRCQARYLIHGGMPFAEWMTKLTSALEEAGNAVGLRAEILLDIAVVLSNVREQEVALEYCKEAIEFARRAGDKALVAQGTAGLLWGSFLNSQGFDADAVELAAEGPEQPPRLAMERRPNVVLGHVLHLTDDLDRARAIYQKEYRRAKDEGVETGLPLLLWGLVETEAYAGNWAEAERLADEGCQLAEDSASLPSTAFMVAVRGLVHVYRGRLEDGLRDGERAIELDQALGMSFPTLIVAQYSGLAHLSVGDAEGAYGMLAPLVEAVIPAGVSEPALQRFLPDAIEALTLLGRLDDAAALLDDFETRSQQFGRRFGIAAAGRCRGLLLAAADDMAGAIDALRAAERTHREIPLPFEYARTLLALGRVHRRRRQKKLANACLVEALAIFERLGAPLWAEQTRSDLNRLGLRQTTAGANLTVAERRVAELVATGLTNAQVAAQLFMAPRTVEAHLTRIYRKLGVNTRTGMSRHLLRTASPDPASTPDSGHH